MFDKSGLEQTGAIFSYLLALFLRLGLPLTGRLRVQASVAADLASVEDFRLYSGAHCLFERVLPIALGGSFWLTLDQLPATQSPDKHPLQHRFAGYRVRSR